MRESHRFGGSYTYACDMGFVFWTSPVYLNGRFSGALLGGGFSGTDTDPRKIKAMAELLLVCAKTLSTGSEDFYAAIKRRQKQQANLSAKIEELKHHYPPGSPKPEYPLNKEQELLESIGQGDDKMGGEILNEILAFLLFLYPDQIKHIQYRAMELAVLISRTNTGSGFSVKTVLASNNRNIKSIEEAETIEEITDVLHRILDETAGQIRSFHGIQHASALKKAEQYILENFSRKISLDEIAGAAGFSAPYFSTIFKEEMGENLSSYLNRLRVKKAAYMLSETNLSLSKIAHACGFEDQSWFSKIFKIYTGTNPGKHRKQEEQMVIKIPEPVFSDEYRLLIKK
jgi:AraC-like DNA-binding protein